MIDMLHETPCYCLWLMLNKWNEKNEMKENNIRVTPIDRKLEGMGGSLYELWLLSYFPYYDIKFQNLDRWVGPMWVNNDLEWYC